MKKEEVPQDLKFFKDTVIRDIAYAVDENGNYTPVISDGWEVKNEAINLAWEELSGDCEEIRKQVLDGKKSPLEFHMAKNVMPLKLLATYTGFSKWTVKKHMKPDKFKNLDESILQKYADALRISVEDIKKVNG